MAAYVGLSQQINFARLPSPGDRFDLRDLIGEGNFHFLRVVYFKLIFSLSTSCFELKYVGLLLLVKF